MLTWSNLGTKATKQAQELSKTTWTIPLSPQNLTTLQVMWQNKMRILKNLVFLKPNQYWTKNFVSLPISGKFSDRCLPPPPAPALESHSIWDPATANVSLISSSNNNSPSSSAQSLTSSTSSQSSISEHLKTFPWYRHCDRRKAEELLLNCKIKCIYDRFSDFYAKLLLQWTKMVDSWWGTANTVE